MSGFETLKKTTENNKSTPKKDLTPSKDCLKKYKKCNEKQQTIRLREILDRQEYKKTIKIEVSGEKIQLNFKGLKLKGRPTTEKELQERLKSKNPLSKIKTDDISFSYKIEKIEGREALDLSFDINANNLTNLTKNIKEQIEGTFGGTYERYKKLATIKTEENKTPQETTNKEETEKIKQEASKNKNKVSTISGNGKFVMVIKKPQGGKKITITSTGTMFSYETTSENQKPNKQNNLTVQEILEKIRS